MRINKLGHDALKAELATLKQLVQHFGQPTNA
jgi:hypothetical protein